MNLKPEIQPNLRDKYRDRIDSDDGFSLLDIEDVINDVRHTAQDSEHGQEHTSMAKNPH
jgi:hypothetical protein